MASDIIVRRLKPSTVVGIVYATGGSAMHNTHSVIRRIYTGNSREEIERALAEDLGITGDVNKYLNTSWASISYYDDQAEAEVERQGILDSHPDAATQVRATTPVFCVNVWGKLRICTAPNNTTYTVSPLDLGVPGFSQAGDKLESGTVFTVPYHLAKFLTISNEAFEIVE